MSAPQCTECKGPTDNEYRVCAGAAAQHRHYGGDELDYSGCASCNCCEACRVECNADFLQSVDDGDQESQEETK